MQYTRETIYNSNNIISRFTEAKSLRTLLIMDEHNYDETLDEIYRVAVRGIIFMDGKLIMLQSSFGEIKFPGGGQEEEESDFDTLIREVKEETGYHVNPASVKPFGEVVEKRLSTKEPKIWHQINRYYFCDVLPDVKTDVQLSASEQRNGYKEVAYTVDEAIEINTALQKAEGIQVYNKRELNMLRILKNALIPC